MARKRTRGGFVLLGLIGAAAAFVSPAGAVLEEGAFLTPSPFPGPVGRVRVENGTIASRREVVSDWRIGISPAPRWRADAHFLISNIVVPAFQNRIRYSFYEAEVEPKGLILDGRAGGGVSLGMSAYLNRFWLQAEDGLGAVSGFRRTFVGAKLLVEGGRPAWVVTAALRSLTVLEEDKTAVTLGLAPRVRVFEAGTSRMDVVAEAHPFLSNPLDYHIPWAAGLQWSPGPALVLSLGVSNTYGSTTPDTFAASRFPQYHVRWAYQF